MGSQSTYTDRRTDPPLEDLLARVVPNSPDPLKRVYGFANVCREALINDGGFPIPQLIGFIDTHSSLFADTPPAQRGTGWVYADVPATRAFLARLGVPTWTATSPHHAKTLVPEISQTVLAHRTAAGIPIPTRADGTPALFYTDIPVEQHVARSVHISSTPLNLDRERVKFQGDIASVRRSWDNPKTVGDPLRQVPWITQCDVDALFVRPDGHPVAMIERKGSDARSASELDVLAQVLAERFPDPFLTMFWTPQVVRARVHGGPTTPLHTVYTDTDADAERVLESWLVDRVFADTYRGRTVQFPR